MWLCCHEWQLLCPGGVLSALGSALSGSGQRGLKWLCTCLCSPCNPQPGTETVHTCAHSLVFTGTLCYHQLSQAGAEQEEDPASRSSRNIYQQSLYCVLMQGWAQRQETVSL